LSDKTFYVTVSYWWDNGIGIRNAVGNSYETDGRPEENDLLIQMTGLAFGGSIDVSNNKMFFSFTVKDYMAALAKQFIFNSPFFDAVPDHLAVYELARMAGFDDNFAPSSGVINRKPLGYLQNILQKNGQQNASGRYFYNGEVSYSPSYDLPGSYADLANPSVRFQNSETYESAVKKIAALYDKTIYFDRFGVLKLELSAAAQAAFGIQTHQTFKSVFDFISSPLVDVTIDSDGNTVSTGQPFDPAEQAAHLIYETIRYTRSVEDCVNQLIILSATNDARLPDGSSSGGLLVAGNTFFEQLWDPNATGFLGFRKVMYQSSGVFGSIESVRNALQRYATMKNPPAIISFQTYTVPGIKPLDIITVDGDYYYITSISSDIDPAANRAWMNVEGEWLFPGKLDFLKENPQQNPTQ